jgi:hypothetical protein
VGEHYGYPSNSRQSDPLAYELFQALARLGSQAIVMQDLQPVLDSFDLHGVAEYIRRRNPKNVVCMVGAGVSVSAGIPDFRSPKTGVPSLATCSACLFVCFMLCYNKNATPILTASLMLEV